LFDLDRDRRLDYHEFRVALRALGFELSKPELRELMHEHGSSRHDGPDAPPAKTGGDAHAPAIATADLRIGLSAFRTLAASLILARNPEDEINRAFDLFDAEGNGIITLEDLKRVNRELREEMDEDQLVAMIEEFDLDGNGGVTRETFLSICSTAP
jgi:centrin-3